MLSIRKVGFESLPVIARMNRGLFNENRIINRFDRPDLIILMAFFDGEAVGFKIGYGLQNGDYYSAKGGVIESFRRAGVARSLLVDMMRRVQARGYRRFTFDTFPNLHVGMTLLAINEGFVLTSIDFSDSLEEYRFRFSKSLDTYGAPI